MSLTEQLQELPSTHELTPSSVEDSAVLVRSPECQVIQGQKMVLLVSSRAPAWAITRSRAEVRHILQRTRENTTVADIIQQDHFDQNVLRAILGLFLERGVLLEVNEGINGQSAREVESRPCKRMCVCICGSIQAAWMLPCLVALRTQIAEEVEVVLTTSAERFLKREALDALGFRTWPVPRVNREAPVPHIWLAERSDLILVLPATASAVNRIAQGMCSDMLSLIVSATRAPVVVAPSMHPNMWTHGPIRRNLQILVRSGFYLVEPGRGTSASSGMKTFGFHVADLSESNIARVIMAVLKHCRTNAGRDR